MIRQQLVRSIGAAQWKPPPWPAGFWTYNTHHQHYQIALPPAGKPFVLDRFLLEATDAQFALWLERVRAARAMVAETLAKPEFAAPE